MFFLKSSWKCIGFLFIFSTSFVHAEFLPAKSDNNSVSLDTLNRISKNQTPDSSIVALADALLKAEKERRDFLKYNMFLADAVSGITDTDLSDRYLDTIEDLEENSRNGLFLVNRVFDLCKYLDGKINDMPLTYEEKLKIKLRLDEIREDAREYGITLKGQSAAQNITECAILETNSSLQVVVLGTGFLDNSKTGIVWVIEDADNALVKIIAVRPYASAAIVIEGDLGKISPGMKAKTINK